MPVYEYRCPNGHLFEQFKRMGDPAPETCDVCGEGPVQIVLYPVAVHFKGSGFYSTDYGRGSRKPAKDEAGVSSDGKGETKTEDKKAAEA